MKWIGWFVNIVSQSRCCLWEVQKTVEFICIIVLIDVSKLYVYAACLITEIARFLSNCNIYIYNINYMP